MRAIMEKKKVNKKIIEENKILRNIEKVYFDDTWIKAFGKGYAGPCSWCK